MTFLSELLLFSKQAVWVLENKIFAHDKSIYSNEITVLCEAIHWRVSQSDFQREFSMLGLIYVTLLVFAFVYQFSRPRSWRHLNNDYYVTPNAIETLGSYGPYALDFIKDIGRRIKESTGEKRATSYLMQTIGIAIQRGNSQCILSTVKDSRKMDEVYYL